MSKELITVIVAHNNGILAAQHKTLGLYELIDLLKKDDPVWESAHISTIIMPAFENEKVDSIHDIAFKYFS